jgi:hypothetical protein
MSQNKLLSRRGRKCMAQGISAPTPHGWHRVEKCFGRCDCRERAEELRGGGPPANLSDRFNGEFLGAGCGSGLSHDLFHPNTRTSPPTITRLLPSLSSPPTGKNTWNGGRCSCSFSYRGRRMLPPTPEPIASSPSARIYSASQSHELT